MEVFVECLPCMLRGALEAAQIATDDQAVQRQIMEQAIGVLSNYQAYQNAPDIARHFQRIVKAQTGNTDPYLQIKQRDLDKALRLLPQVRSFVESQDDPLYWALKAAATGNVLDTAITLDYDTSGFDAEFKTPFAVCDQPVLLEKLKTAKTLLLIGDNTGETVLDTLVLRQFPNLALTYAVRDVPALNDTTMDEAIASGLDQFAEIISTGCDVPGVLLEECSEEFTECFFSSDIVIAKGQGNYETLSESPRDIFNLLKAKCPVIARVLDVPLNSFVFRYYAGSADK